MESEFVIYWEKDIYTIGFVSYGNIFKDKFDEYHPLRLEFATRFKHRKDALKLMNWYISRGGFGLFKIMELKR